MEEIQRFRHRRIRQLFYICNFFVLLFMVALLSFLYFRGLSIEYTKSIEQLRAGIMEQKSSYIKSVINEKISDIEQIQRFYDRQSHRYARILLQYIKYQLEDLPLSRVSGDFPPLFTQYVKETGLDQFDYVISHEGKPVISSLPAEADPESSDDFPIWDNLELNNGYSITVLLSRDERLKGIKRYSEDIIRNTHLPDDGYIWVNWILNYKGGREYAIRLVHPNLPETEGQYLDTSTEDITGLTPYQTELQGIVNEGEVFYDYYFKKMHSEKVAHKLTYAKLYKPFDWVIATGIYLDDVDSLLTDERQSIRRSIRKEIIRTCIIILFCTLLSIVLIVVFERQIRRRIKELMSRIEEMAYEDSLTGLLNRRAMLDHLQQEISRYRRGASSFSVIMFDIDLFKKVNDTYGHPMGDEVIKRIAGIMKDKIRHEDKAGRWGGEEFLLLITDSEKEQGVAAAEKIRKVIESEIIEHDGESLSVTVTAGVACFQDDDDLDQVVARADECLYKGKTSGRNCVISEV